MSASSQSLRFIFESETVLKFYDLEACVLKAIFSSIVLNRENIYNNNR